MAETDGATFSPTDPQSSGGGGTHVVGSTRFVRPKSRMGHKWGWYPETLGEALKSVGLVNIRQEPAQMHMKDVRDFRLIGEKE